MKSLTALAFFVIVNLAGVVTLYGQESSSRIAILPFHANGIDSVYIQTAESILRTEIGKLGTMDIVSQKRMLDTLEGTACWESDCALALGKKLNASQVVVCQLSPLGEKIIVQFFLVNTPSNSVILVDEATAPKIEDLEAVMKRIAQSIVEHQSMGKSAEVGNITPAETAAPLRRATLRNFGLSFGYLYPQNGTYDHSGRIFVMDARFDYELNDYAVGMLLGLRNGFASNLYGMYLLSRKDVCPYVGGALGFHWVSPDNSDGFELTASTGIRVMHTYNFELVFNLEYIYSLNDYNDRALVFTMGIL